MILADKIIELRKKNGWSQEDLAEKLHFLLNSFFASAFLCRAYSKIGKNLRFGKCSCSFRLYSSHTSENPGCREESELVNLTTESCKALILERKRDSVCA